MIGNPAGDADSIISSIGLAYVDTIVAAGNQDEAKKMVIPIISISSDDLKTQRPETTYLLQKCASVELNDLITIDSLPPSIHATTPPPTVTLVDHNHLSTTAIPGTTTSDWIVTEIIDHHVDEQQHTQTCQDDKRNIAFEGSQALVASTCTLIVERYFTATTTKSSSMPPTLAILLLGVILLDSINMLPQAGKGTPRDGAAIDKLLHDTNWDLIKLPKEILSDDDNNSNIPDPSKLFECLQSQKFSLEFWNGLTALQGIRLDYKSFTAAPTIMIGISTILLDMETFWKKEKLIETLSQVIEENDLEIFGLMFTYMKQKEEGDDDDNDNGNSNKPCRQLALTSKNKEVLQNLAEYLMKNDTTNDADYVNLELIKQHQEDIIEEQVTVIDDDNKQRSATILYIMKFDQQNASASRKQVAPTIMGYWK